MFLLTSDLETSPMVVQQALASGKPVIVTNCGGAPYLVDHGINGFVVERNNPSGIAEAIVNLANDNTMRRKFGINARQAALSRFKSDLVAAKTYDVYKQILMNEGK
jgi:glycosyltransferase involved in cell wall biosynthesis